MDLPELYLRRAQEEPYANMGKTEEQIKHLMSRDKKQKNIRLKAETSRDISHLRDKLRYSKKIPPLPLPTDIQNLKNIMQSSNNKGIQIAVSPSGVNHLTCTHKECVERVATHNSSRKLLSMSSSRKLASLNSSPVLDMFPAVEREFLGNPTGVQEIESLYEWFNLMKGQCEDEESTEAVYTMCARELLRQVSVHSTLRGKLLQEIIEMQPLVFGRRWEKLNADYARYKEEQEKRVEALEKKHQDILNQKIIENTEILNNLKKAGLYQTALEETIKKYKKNILDLKQKCIDCDNGWKKRLSGYLDEFHRFRRTTSLGNKRVLTGDLFGLKNQELLEDAQQFDLFVESLSHLNNSSEDYEKLFGGEEPNDFSIGIEKPINEHSDKNELVEGFDHPMLTGEINTEDREKIDEIDKKFQDDYIENNEIFIQDEEAYAPEAIQDNIEKKGEIIADSIEAEAVISKPEVGNDDKNNTNEDIIILDPSALEFTDKLENDIYELEERVVKIYDEGATFSGEKINEVASIDEESREINEKSLESGGNNMTKHERLTLNQEIQTEDILFERFLEKLKYIEELVTLARPEDVQNIHNALQNLLETDISALQQSSNQSIRTPLKSPRTSAKKLLSDRNNALLLDLVSKTAVKSSEPSPRASSPTSSKNVKEVTDELLNSITFLNSAIQSKKREALKLEQQIEERSKILRLISKKKLLVSDETSPANRRQSEKALTDSPIAAKIKKRTTDAGLNDTEAMPWDEGYEVGYGDGKIQGYLRAIEKIKEVDYTNEIDSDDVFAAELKPFSKRKVDKMRIFTKFLEFNFHIPTKAKPKKIHPGPIILEKFLSRPLNKIKMRSTLSRKNINKILISIYNASVQRANTEGSLSLAETTYDEFYARYGLKSVCDRKVLEFVASAISNFEHKRCLMYLRLLRCGEIISSYSYSKYSLLLYLSCYQFVNNSKLGIYFYNDEDDKIMVPTIRLTECCKEKLEVLPNKNTVSSVISKIEQRSIQDPKKINPSGLVELEFGLEIITDTYEKYINNVWNGINLCLKSMGQHKKHTVLAVDFQIIARFVGKNIKESGKDVVVEEMYMICVKNGVAVEHDVMQLTPSLTRDEVFEEIREIKEKILASFEDIKGMEERYATYDSQLWRVRIEIVESNLDEDLFLANLAWKMYKIEFCRVFGEDALVKVR